MDNDGFQKDQNKKIWDLVFQCFSYDLYKTLTWFDSPNPHLGNISPRLMILSGRQEKLLNWIQSTLSENMP